MKPVHATLEINIVDVVQTSEWKNPFRMSQKNCSKCLSAHWLVASQQQADSDNYG